MVVRGRKAQNIAQFNNRIVAQLLLSNPYSCIEMSKKIKLTHTAIGFIVDRLLDMDLIQIHVENISKRTKGRQHVRYEINPKRAFFVCVNLQNGNETLSFYDLVGNVIYSEKINGMFIDEFTLNIKLGIDTVEKISEKLVDNAYAEELIKKIKKCINDLKLNEDLLATISIAIPGRVDNQNGNIIVSSKVSREVNLKEAFAKHFNNIRIELKNDIVYACTGSMLSNEFDYGKGSHLFVYIGAGLSCCLINNSEMVTSANGFGGEIGMNYIDRNGMRLNEAISINEVLELGKKVFNNPNLTLKEVLDKSADNEILKEKILEIAKDLAITAPTPAILMT